MRKLARVNRTVGPMRAASCLILSQLLTTQAPDEIESHFVRKGYAQLKQELADVTVEFLQPFQERVQRISDQELNLILEQGRDKAQRIASATLRDVMAGMGIFGAGRCSA